MKVDILVNGEPVDALSLIVHRDRAHLHRTPTGDELKELIPRQMFEIPIQAAIGSNVVARRIGPRDAKERARRCHGGDITRKREAAREAERRQTAHEAGGFGRIPQEAFLAMLRMGEG